MTPDTALISVMYANNEVGSIQPIAEIAADRPRGRGATPCRRDPGGRMSCEFSFSTRCGFGLALRAQVLRAKRSRRARGPAQCADRLATTRRWPGGRSTRRHGERGRDRWRWRRRWIRANEYRDAVRRALPSVRDRLWAGDRVVDRRCLAEWTAAGWTATRQQSQYRDLPACRERRCWSIWICSSIAASAGSACSVGKNEPSHVLLAMGRSVEEARSSLRLTVGRPTSEEEIRKWPTRSLRSARAFARLARPIV